jgi:hypothetical protein
VYPVDHLLLSNYGAARHLLLLTGIVSVITTALIGRTHT